MSTTVPAVTTTALTPVNVKLPATTIDYDFETILAAPPKQRVMLWLMVSLIAATTAWLAVTKVNVIVTATGKLATSASGIVVQPLETSIVRSIAVKAGQKVKAGDVVATLDPTFPEADETELSAKLRSLQATYDRLSAEIRGEPYGPTHPNPDQLIQLNLWRKRQAEYAARINAADRKVQELRADLAAHKIQAEGLQKQIDLAGEANRIYQTLVARNLASKLKLIETDEHLVEATSRLETNRGEQNRLIQQIAQTLAERKAFVSEWGSKLASELAKTRLDRDSIAAQLSKAQLRRRMAVLRAPRDATVLEVADRPEGSVVRVAEPLIRLVPADAPIIGDILIDTRDVARLHVGDPVTVKFEALPWQQFGLAHGVLKSITPDALADANPRETAEDTIGSGLKPAVRESTIHYRARVALTELKLRNLPNNFNLRPGMRIVADIKLGRRSVLDYVLDPVTRVISDSLREP